MIEHAAEAPINIYYEGLRQGKLLYQYSLDAHKPFYPPRIVCPFSASERFEWRESSGLGTVYSFSSVTGRDRPSYAVALVDVDEGFRMLSKIVNATGEEVAIGSRVRLAVGVGGEDEPTAFFELDRAQ
jgi:uncharacterized OB-fold protein